MTTEPTWDDERLAAAFRARFERPAPVTLEGSIRARLAASRPARLGPVGQRSSIAAAIAAILVVAVGGVAIGLGGFGQRGDRSPSSTLPSAAATATATAARSPDRPATAASPPTAVLWLAVLDIRAALTIRDAGVDDRELAVAGWFTPAPNICRPPPAKGSPLELQCPDEFTWLTENADSLVHATGNLYITDTPQGPALHPDLDGVDQSWAPPLPAIGVDGASTPAHVVMLGHFDDRRAATCPKAEQAGCRDRFVVDQVAWVNGAPPSPSRVDLLGVGVRPSSSVADVQAILAAEAPGSPELSMVIVGGTSLKSIEPSVGTSAAALTDHPVVWIARLLESDRIATYLVVDGTDAIFEIRTDGAVIQVGGSLGSPPPAPPWPPAGSTVVQLSSQVGGGRPPVQVAVTDRSGRLTRAFERTGRAPAPDPGANGFAAYAEPGLEGGVHLAWLGTVCDSRVTVTVAADLRSMTIDRGPQPACDAMGISRQIVLDFSGAVDVSAIQLHLSSTVID